MRKLSVLAALITGAGALAMFAPAAGAISPPGARGSVSCPAAGQAFSGTMTVSGKSLNDKHASGPREATFEVKAVPCATDGVTGTHLNRSIDSADIKVKLPIASTTCSGLTSALTLGTGSVAEIAQFKHTLEINGHRHSITAATASGHKFVSAGTPGSSISVPLNSVDFRGETATLSITSQTAHCDGKHKTTVSFTASFAVAP